MTNHFTFRSEVVEKYDESIYDLVIELFQSLPLAAVVGKKFFAVHGGVSSEVRSLEDVNEIKRSEEIPRVGAFCDLMWADPTDAERGRQHQAYVANESRGCSYNFGVSAANRFLSKNRLISIIRAHEVQADGFRFYKWNGEKDFPVVITVFSAPNYCDVYNNKGAILALDVGAVNIKQYNYSAHPFLLPKRIDAFQWSFPFLAEKVLGMTKRISELFISGEEEEEEKSVEVSRAEVMRNKVKFLGKAVKMQKVLRADHELLVQIKGMCPDNRIPKGLLLEGTKAI